MSTPEKDEELDKVEFKGEPSEESSGLDEYEAVVRNNKSYYGYKWGLVPDPAKKSTWNWAAFFLPFFWLPYRKMFKPFYILGLMPMLLTVVYSLIAMPDWLYAVILLACSLGSAFVVGWNGNRLYFIHITKILERAKTLPEKQRVHYIQNKGGTHIGTMLGLHLLLSVAIYGVSLGSSYIPTEKNITDVVHLSGEGIALDLYNDNPKWKVIHKMERYYVVEFTGYDYAYDENVRILFNVYFDKYYYEWFQVHINGGLLNDEETDDYIDYVNQ
ncbi:DUF2628 domain-containing protein [Neobacillus sp. NRS-1170]|uniref:DUF2628 domain-containing protein n=1 Tax=Neobacillus sp. NRS-1170 TaxID=3233898 RepID=UPI003D29593F